LKAFTTIKDGSRLCAGDLAIVIENDYVEWKSVTDVKRRGYFLRKVGTLDAVKMPVSVDDVCLVLGKNEDWVTIMASNGNIGNIKYSQLGKIN
jgi:hypothetical protein